MFVQVIQGHVHDADGLRAALERWLRDLQPGSIGWLGSTAGTTDDGRFVMLARFESAEAARRNSDRPEQGQWWAETSRLLSEVTFHDCDEVLTMLGGGSDDAGFVQVIQGRSDNPGRVRELFDQTSEPLRAHPTDIIGGIVALHGDGGFTNAVYLTSEAEATPLGGHLVHGHVDAVGTVTEEGEKKPGPPEFAAQWEEASSLMKDLVYYDLRDPWLHSPTK